MEKKARKLLIIDVDEEQQRTAARDLFKMTPEQMGQAAVRGAARDALAKLSGSAFAEYGRNLDTVVKARAWLEDRRNWHPGQMHIIKWDGLTPTISASHGERLVREWWDDGLPQCVAVSQKKYREGKREKEEDIDPSDVIE